MRLSITTPLEVVVDVQGVSAVRARDVSGAFGILPRHADLLTVLPVSILSWTGADKAVHYCALRRGVMTMSGGEDVAIATREAVAGDDLATLDEAVIARFESLAEAERSERAESTKLQLDAIRQIMRYLRPAELRSGGLG